MISAYGLYLATIKTPVWIYMYSSTSPLEGFIGYVRLYNHAGFVTLLVTSSLASY